MFARRQFQPSRFLPAGYLSAIRRGGTFVGDGALGTRWSGLVECVSHFR